MNGDLRRAVYKKRMLFSKYKKIKSPINWENYRLQRNRVTKLKKTSMRAYFLNDVLVALSLRISGPPSSPFYPKRGLMVAQKSYYLKMIKSFQTKRMYVRSSMTSS